MADLNFSFGADPQGLDKVLAGVTQKFDALQASLPTRGFQLFSSAAAGLGVTLGAGAFVAAIKGAIDNLDDLNDAAQSAGVSVETLSSLRYAASFAGVGADELQKSLEVLNGRLGDAAGGSKEAASAFEAIGIKVRNSSGQLTQTDEVLAQLADKFASYRDGAEKTALAVDLFGQRIGPKLIPFLNQGSSGIEELRKEAEKLGLVIGGDAAAAADKFNDQLERLRQEINALRIGLATDLLPFLTKTVEEFNAARKAAGGFFSALVLLAKQSAETLDDPGKKIQEIYAKIAEQQRLIETDRTRSGVGASAARRRIAELQQELDFLKEIQRNRILASTGDISDTDARIRGAGGVAPIVPKVAAKQDDYEKRIRAQAAETEKFLDNLDKLNQEAAQKEVARLEALDDARARAQVNELLALDRRLDAIRESFKSEREVAESAYQDQVAALNAALENELTSREEYNALLEEAELRHQAALGNISAEGALARRKFEQMNALQQTQFVLGQLMSLTSGMAQSNRTMFEINKAAGIGNAIVDTYAGATKAYAQYGWPWGAIAAALVVAAGLANIAQIKNAKFGSSSAPSVGGGTATPITNVGPTGQLPVTPTPATAPRNISITLQGDNFSAQNVRDLIEQINEQSDFGAEIVVRRG